MVLKVLCEVKEIFLAVIVEVTFTLKGLNEGLVRRNGNSYLTLGELGSDLKRGNYFFSKFDLVARDIVDRIFKKRLAVVHLDNEAALRHRALAYIGHHSVGIDRGRFNVGAKYSDVGKAF